MALVVKDRVQVTTSTTGTGTLTLGSAVTGFQDFSVIGDSNTTYYAITSNGAWEVGIGTYTASGTTLSRDTVLDSSAAGAKISLTGISNVFVTYPAGKGIYKDASGNAIALGTPSSVTLTNATGLPVSTGISGLGTNVATALAVNVGSSGAVVTNGGALGTPSSGTVTNLTGTASININGTVGATTANTGTFTSLKYDFKTSSGYGLNIEASYSYNDNNVNTIGGSGLFNNAYFNILVFSNGDKMTVIPYYPNGGAGTGWAWTGLDNDAGTWSYSATGLTRTFTQAGTGGNTFSIVLNQNNGSGTIQRTSGTQAYTVKVQMLVRE